MIQRGKKVKDLPELVQEVVQATKQHEQYRDKECINMIASEGIKSPAVCQMLDMSHDLATRYAEGENDAEGHVKKRYYQGQKYMSQIEDLTTDMVKSLFGATWADVRLISGTHANTSHIQRFIACIKKQQDGCHTAKLRCPHQP